MDRATVTYLVDGTTRQMLVTGPRISVQMGRRGTAVSVSAAADPGRVERVLMFRRADHVDIERGVRHV